MTGEAVYERFERQSTDLVTDETLHGNSSREHGKIK